MEREAYEFGGFRVQPDSGILEHHGQRIPIAPKVLDTLAALIRANGEVVNKDELMSRVWGGTYVAESGLTRNISILRKTLGEFEPGVGYIETIPKHGYRFVGTVTLAREPPEPAERIEKPPWWKSKALLAVALAATLIAVAATRKNGASVQRIEADRDFIVAAHLLGRADRGQLEAALGRLRGAADSKPRSADAWAALAIAHSRMTGLSIGPPASNLDKARECAMKSLELDPRSAAPHLAMGDVLLHTGDAAGAEREYRRALELDPRSTTALVTYADFLAHAGRFDEARMTIREAANRDEAPLAALVEGRIEYFAGRNEHATARFHEVLRRAPDSSAAHLLLSRSLAALGKFAEARDQLRRSGVHPELAEAEEAGLSAQAGDRRPARDLFAKRMRMVREGRPPVLALWPAIDAGEHQAAIDLLEALEKDRPRSPELLSAKANPRFAPLRSEPRFQALLRRVLGGQN